MSKPESCILSGGFLMAFLIGISEPALALLVAETLDVRPLINLQTVVHKEIGLFIGKHRFKDARRHSNPEVNRLAETPSS